MNWLYQFSTKAILLIMLSMSGYVFGAASSSGSEAIASSYYSPENLQRINDENVQRMERQELLVQKHAPLLIYADPSREEKDGAGAFTRTVVDVLKSSFSSVIIMSFSLFNNVVTRLYQSENVDPQEAISKNYVVYDVVGTQLVVLIPHWYRDLYASDFGLNDAVFDEQGDISLYCQQKKDSGVVTELSDSSKFKELSMQFVTELKTVFRPHREAQAPVWDICFGGHGSAKRTGGESASICGLRRSHFIEVLKFFNTQLRVGVLYVESCNVGGANAQYIGSAIDTMSDALTYDLILGSSDDSVMINPIDIAQLYRNLFQNAATLSVLSDSYKTEFAQLVVTLADDAKRNTSSTNLPQVRLRGSKKFKVFSDSSVACIKNKKYSGSLMLPAQTRLVLCYPGSIDDDLIRDVSIHVSPYRLSTRDLAFEYNEKKLLSTLFFNTFEQSVGRLEWLEQQHADIKRFIQESSAAALSLEIELAQRSKSLEATDNEELKLLHAEIIRELEAKKYHGMLQRLEGLKYLQAVQSEIDNISGKIRFLSEIKEENSVLIASLSDQRYAQVTKGPLCLRDRLIAHVRFATQSESLSRLYFLLFPSLQIIINEVRNQDVRRWWSELESLRFPEFLNMSSPKTVSETSRLIIKHIEIESENPCMGIHTFLVDAFLSKKSEKTQYILIKSITGFDDITLMNRLLPCYQDDSFQGQSMRLMSSNQSPDQPNIQKVPRKITLSDVRISIESSPGAQFMIMTITFWFDNEEFELVLTKDADGTYVYTKMYQKITN